jgi:hypothetical protein
VVFPEPFGPKKPTLSPFSILKETSRKAEMEPKTFVRFSTLIISFKSYPAPSIQSYPKTLFPKVGKIAARHPEFRGEQSKHRNAT